ncbi:heptaprenyl diphosphate synthase component II [Mangrovibacillus cuniculi]|uniref:Heptaprenyl diphosphate synthase component 2 n=1 Tax=Mangrovibacillus cuniculi TaxID=2593652 RepID=A0A7S8HFA5_9BACI|nr:heptaprenyl diphosphate synthase component II [Mangrovibacillus cuniculi]QPC46699.1 heptaprenyl diphosphate synthase component II [Mangrovibacillus cuniculi]
MKLSFMYSFLKSDIDVIERELEMAIRSNSSLLNDASLQFIQAGGKRIRPVFVLLSAKFGDYDIEKVKHVAVALELIHMASLVHDDVIDDAETRRGKKTIKAIHGNRIAMYTGDYIFARSLEYMSAIESEEAHKILAETIVEVCLGEVEQIKDKYVMDQHVKTYFRRIKRKTALLIAVSCQLGGIAAGASKNVHRNLWLYGYYVGMSYQIIDDILDFTATEKELGKPAGGDLLQGNITLPVLFAREDKEIAELLESIYEDMPKEQLEVVLEKIKNSDAIEKSYKVSQAYLQKALKVVDRLPDQKIKKTLKDIALYIGKRKS